MPPVRWGRAGVVGVAVVVAALGCAGCAGSSEPAAEPSSSTTVAVTSDPTQLVVGRVTRDGEPVAGVRVSGDLWPDDPDLAVGDVVDTYALPPATTDADGRWQLVLDVADVEPRYFVGGAGGDTVNLELLLRAKGDVVSWNVPLSRTPGPPGQALWRSSPQDGPDAPAHRVDVDLGSAVVRDVTSDGTVTEGDATF